MAAANENPPSVRAGGAGHCKRPTTVWSLPRDASNGAFSRANAPNARSSTARGRERNGHNRGGKTSTLRRQRLDMPLSRRGDALVTCSREPAMRTPPTRLVTATKAASTGDTQTDRSNRLTSFVSRARLSSYTAVIGRFSWSLRHQGLCIVCSRDSKVKSAMCNATPARIGV